MIPITGAEVAAGADPSSAMATFTVAAIAATLLGVIITYLLISHRERRKSREDLRSTMAVIYQEIKDNMLSLNAGTQIGLMKVSTSGMDLLKARNLYLHLPDDVLKDLLSIYWYFNFINDIVNWELSLFMVSVLTSVDSNKIFEINDHQAKETHRRCLKEIQKTRILSRLEDLMR
jgi:hypothetical protein